MTDTGDMNLVEIWLRRDIARWIAGAFAGFFGGLVSILVGGLLSKLIGGDFWVIVKLGAIPLLQANSMEYGFNLPTIITGAVIYQGLATFLGILYAHFTGTNNCKALFGVGLTWAAFSWIFLNNLYFNASRTYFVVGLPKALMFAVCLAYGVSLVSVSFFDRVFRR